MAFTVQELKDRSYSNDGGKREHVRTWLVVSDDPEATGDEATSAIGETIYVSTYGTSLTCWLLSLEANCVSDDGLSWHVKGTYGPLPSNNEVNPLFAPFEIEWDNQQFSTLTDQTIDGTPILNTAGDPYAEAVEIDDAMPILSVTGNLASYNPALAFQYRNAVNSDTFFGCSPGCCKVGAIKAKLIRDSNWGDYWQVSYQIQFNVSGFDKVLLNQGLREIKISKRQNILVQGVPISEPALLAQNGEALVQGGQPVFHSWRVYPRLPFNGVFRY